MIIKVDEKGLNVITKAQWETMRPAYEIRTGSNGCKYVTMSSVLDCFCHVAEGNSKTGEKCLNYNLSIENSCDHNCECYKEGKCYAEGGCYLYGDNQAGYTDNSKFVLHHTNEQIIAAWQLALDFYGYKYWRYFTCGDIPFMRFIDCMVQFARNNPEVKFWTYTKKYSLVNKWIDENGNLPENLTIIFSHWLNNDGTYFPMNNRHNLPTSEFIPYGMEKLAEKVTHICPCSDPTVNVTCITCDHACHSLKNGESMALLEHSTSATKQRDRAIKAAKKALKK